MTAEFYLVDRGLRHRLLGFSSLGRLGVLPQGLRSFDCRSGSQAQAATALAATALAATAATAIAATALVLKHGINP